MIGSSYIMVSEKLSLKSSIMDVGNWVTSGMNAQGNRQANPILMVWLVYSKVLLFCHGCNLMLLIWCKKTDYGRGFPLFKECQYGFLGI